MKEEIRVETFGQKLRRLRKERGLSQEEVGLMIGTSKQVISRYENSLRSPKIDIASALAGAMDVTLSYFSDNISEDMCQQTEQPSPANDHDELYDAMKMLGAIRTDGSVDFDVVNALATILKLAKGTDAAPPEDHK